MAAASAHTVLTTRLIRTVAKCLCIAVAYAPADLCGFVTRPAKFQSIRRTCYQVIETFHCSSERLAQPRDIRRRETWASIPAELPCLPMSCLSERVSSAMSSFDRRYGISAGTNAKGFPHLVLKLKEPFI